MSWRRHAPRGHSAEVEDSIQYLRRYLDDAEPDRRQPSLFSPVKEGGVVAAGVLPASAVRRERWDGYTQGVASPGKPRDQPPNWAHGPDRGNSSSIGYNRPSPPRVEGVLRTEKHPPPREQATRTPNSSLHEPLRLRYGSTTSAPGGRPPLHQQQQQQLRRGGAVAQKGGFTGWCGDVSPRREDTSGRGWLREGSNSRQQRQESTLSYTRRMHSDPYSTLDPENAETSHHLYPQRRCRSYQKEGLMEDGKYYDDNEEGEGNEEEKKKRRGTLPPTPRVSTTGDGGGGRRHHAAGSDHSHESRANTSATDFMNSSVRQSAWNGLPTPSGQGPEGAVHPQELFPYPKHEDNLRSMLFYLKNYYALEPQESLRGIETMTPEDVLGLAQCFYVDTYRAVRHARDVAGVGRAGFTDKDPLVDCVLGSASDGEPTARAKGGAEEEAAAAAAVPPLQLLPAPNSLTQSVTSRRAPSQEVRWQRAAVTSDGSGGGGDATRTPFGRSYTSQSHATLEHPMPEGVNTSVVTEGTLPSMGPPQEPSSGIMKRPLKELMPLLRRGSTLCKHVENGYPHTRFFRVEDHLGEYRGEEALMPHLVWYPTATDRKPSGALKLLSLLGVYLLLSDAGGTFRKLFRRNKGVVVDHDRRPVADGMCVVFRFEKRDVAVSFLTEGDRQLWVGGMMGVVEKNRLMASHFHQLPV